MTIERLIRELKNYPLDKEIEIECPNGLLVDPKIKVIRENEYDYSGKIKSYVITWRE